MTMLDLGWWSLLAWSLVAVVKFVVTPSAMVAAGHSALEAWMVTGTGACLGVAAFWHFGKWLFSWIERVRPSRWERGKRVFTPGRRRVVRWKNRFGLNGILLVSGLISVPIATVLAAKYFRAVPYAMGRLMLAFVGWAGLLTGVSWLVKLTTA